MELNNPYQNIYIIGPQSTGKTTLVNALDKAFASRDGIPGNFNTTRPVIIKEVARTVLETYNFTRDDITTSPTRALRLQELILEAQLTAENTVLSEDPWKSWFVSDRSGLDPIVYAKVYVGEDAAQQMIASDNWRALEERMRNGLVVLCEAGCTWLVDDGTRLMPESTEDWLRFHSAFRKVLETLAIDYILMPNSILDLQRRAQVVLNAFYKGSAKVESGEQVGIGTL